jgi:hypothetical protein
MARATIVFAGLSSVLFATIARAEDVDLDVGQPRPVVVQPVVAPPAFSPPRDLQEFDLRRKTLKIAVHDAAKAGDEVAAANLKAQLKQLDLWYRENTHRESTGMFIGGIVMAGVGGAALLVGLSLLLVGAVCYACNKNEENTYFTVGGALSGGGVVVGVGGLTFAMIGGPHVMNDSRGAFINVSAKF